MILSTQEVERKAKQALTKIKPKTIIKANQLAQHLLKRILKDLPLKFTVKGRSNLIVSEKTMDDLIVEFLEFFFYNKDFPKQKDNEIFLYEKITDQELEYYARKNNLKFKPNKKDKKISELIENLARKYPDTKYGLLSSFKKLQNKIK